MPRRACLTGAFAQSVQFAGAEKHGPSRALQGMNPKQVFALPKTLVV